jgi:hypothetical protein
MLLEVPSTFFGSMFGCLPDASMCLDKTLAQVIPEQITSVGILIVNVTGYLLVFGTNLNLQSL